MPAGAVRARCNRVSGRFASATYAAQARRCDGFRDALVRGAHACGLRLVAIPENVLTKHAERALGAPVSQLLMKSATLGKSVGPPWGKDQKEAALAAMVALQGAGK
jgi:hypothetical protein